MVSPFKVMLQDLWWNVAGWFCLHSNCFLDPCWVVFFKISVEQRALKTANQTRVKLQFLVNHLALAVPTEKPLFPFLHEAQWSLGKWHCCVLLPLHPWVLLKWLPLSWIAKHHHKNGLSLCLVARRDGSRLHKQLWARLRAEGRCLTLCYPRSCAALESRSCSLTCSVSAPAGTSASLMRWRTVPRSCWGLFVCAEVLLRREGAE